MLEGFGIALLCIQIQISLGSKNRLYIALVRANISNTWKIHVLICSLSHMHITLKYSTIRDTLDVANDQMTIRWKVKLKTLPSYIKNMMIFFFFLLCDLSRSDLLHYSKKNLGPNSSLLHEEGDACHCYVGWHPILYTPSSSNAQMWK